MQTDKTLHLGQKLRLIREAKGMTLKDVAAAARYAFSTIGQVERGEANCESDMLRMIRVALDIENLPLLEAERKTFKGRLLTFYDLILERKIKEATEVQEKLSGIEFLQFEQELNTYYKLFKSRLLILKGKFDEAVEILKAVEISLHIVDDEITCYYYCSMGVLNCFISKYDMAMEFFLKANKLMRPSYKGHAVLHYNTALCLMRLGYLFHAIKSLEKWHEIFSNEKAYESIRMLVDSMLARNYIRFNYLQDAKALLEKCLAKVEFFNNKQDIGGVFYDYGLMYKTAGDCNSAIEYLNKALDSFEEGDLNYMEALYLKTLCYIDMKYDTLCIEFAATGKRLAEGNEMYTILFESAGHLASLNNSKSTQYIEGVTIPYLLGTSLFTAALVYSEALREFFENKGNRFIKKALQMSEVSRSIYKRRQEGSYLE
ncbi:MAG: helix-turn-helix domain-containing protein [Defluviitaleaceae bacterium]|nr:helix-turn-helix domain-containing protein [Defluviitaleaceae bacterium]